MVTEDGPSSSPSSSPTTNSHPALAPSTQSPRSSFGGLGTGGLRDDNMKRQRQRAQEKQQQQQQKQQKQHRQQAQEEPSQSKVVSFRRDSSTRPRPSKSSDRISEQSPLLIPRQSYDGINGLPPVSPISDDDDDWNGDEKEETKSTGYLALLALTVGG